MGTVGEGVLSMPYRKEFRLRFMLEMGTSICQIPFKAHFFQSFQSSSLFVQHCLGSW